MFFNGPREDYNIMQVFKLKLPLDLLQLNVHRWLERAQCILQSELNS